MLISTGGVIRGKINPISAVIRQEINGEYSCQVSIPLSDNLAEYFIADAIVYLDDSNGKTQQFRLERPERTLDTLAAFGWHITYDLSQDLIVSKKYTSAAGSTVWADLLQAGIQETRFTGTADSSDTNSLTIVRLSVLAALIGNQENSYLNRWGGEIDRDNFTVNMKTQLGQDRDYRIIYRKNLTGIHVTVDNSTVVNRVVPTYLNESEAATLLPEVYIDSANIADTAVPHARHIHYSDIRVGATVDEVIPYPTTASAEAEVRARVAALYASGIDVPLLTVEIGFVQLRNTLEYADYAALEEVQLGDTIGAEYEDYSWTSRVVAYEWDAALGRYNNITLGNVRPSASDMSNRIVDAATIAANAALYQRASELTGAIATAQTTANGKNTVYYSSTEPTGGVYVENDIWFDTDDSNKMHIHDGSDWVPVQFGENAIADLAIGNAKISNLDAGKITTGYLAAARINVDTLYIKKLWANSSVLNYLTYEPYYTWSGQTFAGTQYWTDDAGASPASVQHLLLLGDVNKASAESQTIISAVALNSSGTDLGYETNLKIGAMVPTQLGDGNYGYASFSGNTASGNGSVILGAGNSDGSDYFNVTVDYNQFLVGNENDSDILKLTQYGLDIAGMGIFTSYLKSDRDTGVDIDSIEAVNSSANAWNNSANYDLLLENSNNAMSFILSGTANERKGMIQVGHNNPSFAGVIGELWLNPLGGAVKTTDLTITGSGTIGGATLANGWLKLGTGLAFDDNEMYFSGDCYIGSIGGTVNFRRGTTTIFSFDSDSIDMAKQLNMGSNDITLSGDITGSTSDTSIQARRIGLGVAPNTTYTMDAGTTGYIRAGKYYAGSSGGVSNSYKLKDYNVGGYYTLTFTGGILTGSSWSST